MHSAKGTTWKKHKYIAKKNGRYVYPGSSALRSGVSATQRATQTRKRDRSRFAQITSLPRRRAAEYEGTLRSLSQWRKLPEAFLQDEKDRITSIISQYGDIRLISGTPDERALKTAVRKVAELEEELKDFDTQIATNRDLYDNEKESIKKSADSEKHTVRRKKQR